jgi:hypothetical protein
MDSETARGILANLTRGVGLYVLVMAGLFLAGAHVLAGLSVEHFSNCFGAPRRPSGLAILLFLSIPFWLWIVFLGLKGFVFRSSSPIPALLLLAALTLLAVFDIGFLASIGARGAHPDSAVCHVVRAIL